MVLILVLDGQWQAGYNLLDPALTPEGEEAARVLGARLHACQALLDSFEAHPRHAEPEQPESEDMLLLVSPMRRAMQTAARVFAPLAAVGEGAQYRGTRVQKEGATPPTTKVFVPGSEWY